MLVSERLQQEFDREAQATRQCLELLPESQLGWQPYPGAPALGQLALWIAEQPALFIGYAAQEETPVDIDVTVYRQPASVREVLSAYDNSIAAVRNMLPDWDDARLAASWRLNLDGRTVDIMPRREFLRAYLLNMGYHYRGQLTVYLGLLGIFAPAPYDPNAHERLQPGLQAHAAG
jgi:uncharacterized damage-inducible protein DinB